MDHRFLHFPETDICPSGANIPSSLPCPFSLLPHPLSLVFVSSSLPFPENLVLVWPVWTLVTYEIGEMEPNASHM